MNKTKKRCSPIRGLKIDNGKIDVLMAEKCWGVGDLADALNMTTTALYYQRYKTMSPRTDTVGRIAKVLGVNVVDILKGRVAT